MLIRCPECTYERELDATQIPDSAVMATCPLCSTRFRFREQVVDAEAVRQKSAATPWASGAGEDDPLPPGAIVPPLAQERQKPEDAQASRRESTRTDNARHDAGNASAAPKDKEAQFAEYLRQSRTGEEEPRASEESKRSLFSGGGRSAIPWEYADMQQLPLALYHTLLRALFAVPAFFSAVGESRATLLRPCLFFILLRLFESVMQRFWWLAAIREKMAFIEDPQTLASLDSLAQSMSLSMLLVIAPPLLVIQLMLYSGLFHMVLRLIQPAKANFATTLRVVAYASAPCVFSLVPLNYLTIPGTGVHIISLWVAICCFMGIKHAHRLNWSQAAAITVPLYVFSLLLSLHFAKMVVSSGGLG